MMLQLYHSLPAPARNMAATLRGYYLRSWRYGDDTDALADAALERERWPLERWQQYQTERLAYVLHRAATRVPYYRDQWNARRRNGDHASWEYLENWPILDKEPVRQNPLAFVADDYDPRRMFHEHTSGTTGKSLDLWWSRDTVRQWFALFEARWRRWYGVSRDDRWAILGGQLVTPVSQRKPPFWVWNGAFRQLYMSSYHLSPDLIPHYLDALKTYRIHYLLGYTSSLHELALEVVRRGERLPMTVVIANAEPVYDYQRAAIEAAFGCPLRETYGMAEIVAAAGECEHGRLHLWPEVGMLEPVTDGDLICTSLLNADMPLVRYQVGDTGTFDAAAPLCVCGRTLPVLASVHGRADDVLYTRDGRRIGRLDPVFKSHLPIIEAQIIQETLEKITVRYVPAPDYTSEAGNSIIERLRARMGDIDVILEAVDRIPREPNGKFRAVICQVKHEGRL